MTKKEFIKYINDIDLSKNAEVIFYLLLDGYEEYYKTTKDSSVGEVFKDYIWGTEADNYIAAQAEQGGIQQVLRCVHNIENRDATVFCMDRHGVLWELWYTDACALKNELLKKMKDKND